MRTPACYADSRGILCTVAAFLAVVGTVGCAGGGSGKTPDPIASASPTPTPSPIASPSPTPTPTPIQTPTPVPIAVTVAPVSVTLSVGDTTNLTATVSGADNQAVTWSVLENGGGTITADGAYTAPATPGTYHVIATSQADTARAGQAAVIVQAGSAIGTIQ